MTSKQIEFIKQLETKIGSNGSEEPLQIIINLKKWSLSEETQHYGEWDGCEFTFTAYTNWKRATLECGMSLEDFIDVLKETPIEKMQAGNFYDLWCWEMSDGDTDFENETFTPELTEEQEEELDMWELYSDSEINESEYIFEPDSIWSIEVEVGSDKFIYETE